MSLQADSSIVVSVIIVSYNSQEELPSCLESIFREKINCEVFVVDNASSDDSRQILKEYDRHRTDLKLIFNEENKGLAYANNQPMCMCKGKYVLILNPDTIIKEGSLRLMVEYLDAQQDVGVVGPKCLFDDGKAHTSYHYNWTFFHIVLWRLFPSGFVRYLYDNFARYKEGTVLFVSGACLLIRRELFVRAGGYDEKFFLTVEDAADLCLRVRQQEHYRTVFFPKAEIVHFTGRSQKNISHLVLYYGYQGSLYYLKKHSGVTQSFLLYVVFVIHMLSKGFVAKLLGRVFLGKFNDIPGRCFLLAKVLTRDFVLQNVK